MIADEVEWTGENFDLIDAALARLHRDGLECRSMILKADGVLDMVHLAEAQGSMIRVSTPRPDSAVALGVSVTGYRHPVTGDIVEITCSRWLTRHQVRFSDQPVPKNGPLGSHPDAPPPE